MKRNNIERCRNLRRNQTEAEKKLWSVLRNRQLNGVKFRRQFPVGGYIVDFYCPEYKLGIEADGGQHYQDEWKVRDELRTITLNNLGVEVIRFSDWEILNNIGGVYEVIQKSIEKRRKKFSPSPQSSPRRGEEDEEG
jgi:very-short-patch-repair endonuclease